MPEVAFESQVSRFMGNGNRLIGLGCRCCSGWRIFIADKKVLLDPLKWAKVGRQLLLLLLNLKRRTAARLSAAKSNLDNRLLRAPLLKHLPPAPTSW